MVACLHPLGAVAVRRSTVGLRMRTSSSKPWETAHKQGMQEHDRIHQNNLCTTSYNLRGTCNGRRLRIYGFTDLPPSLPLCRRDAETRISESKRRRHVPSRSTMLFRETRLPRDAVRVLMVLACRRVAARAVSPAVPVHSRAHSFGYIKLTRSRHTLNADKPQDGDHNLPILAKPVTWCACAAHTIA